MNISRAARASSLCLVFGVVACGSRSSGVDTTKDVADTTQAERADICAASVNANHDTLTERQYCKALALSGLDDDDDQNELRADCRRLYDACMVSASELLADSRERQLENCESGRLDSDLACNGVTVGELETCFSDRLDLLLQRVDEAPDCGELTTRDEVEYEDGGVASCERLEDRCDDD